jgi:hypothetical protein
MPDATNDTESLVRPLAAAFHEHYRRQAKKEGWTMRYDQPYEELPPEIQAANLAAARRIPAVLAVAGLQILPPGSETPSLSEDEAVARLNAKLEAVAEAEHEGWMRQKLEDGWSVGERNDAAKKHPSLVPYAQLEQVEKDKDYSAVRVYPGLLIQNGFGIAG